MFHVQADHFRDLVIQERRTALFFLDCRSGEVNFSALG